MRSSGAQEARWRSWVGGVVTPAVPGRKRPLPGVVTAAVVCAGSGVLAKLLADAVWAVGACSESLSLLDSSVSAEAAAAEVTDAGWAAESEVADVVVTASDVVAGAPDEIGVPRVVLARVIGRGAADEAEAVNGIEFGAGLAAGEPGTGAGVALCRLLTVIVGRVTRVVPAVTPVLAAGPVLAGVPMWAGRAVSAWIRSVVSWVRYWWA